MHFLSDVEDVMNTMGLNEWSKTQIWDALSQCVQAGKTNDLIACLEEFAQKHGTANLIP